MRRKVIQLAGKTFVISLPKKWAESFNIKKGDELELEEKGPELLIKTKKSISGRTRGFKLEKTPRKIVELFIKAAYKAGYDEIKLSFEEETLNDLKNNRRVNIFEVVNEEVNKLIGFEVVSQTKKHIIIREVTSPSEKEFESILRRIFLLILELGEESLHSIQNLKLTRINLKKELVDKFIHYCTRLLSKKGYSDYERTVLLHNILSELYKIGDTYNFATLEFLKNAQRSKIKKVSEKALSILSQINKLVRLTYEIFYSYNTKTITESYVLRRQIFDEMNKLISRTKNQNTPETILMTRMAWVVLVTLHIIELKVSMEAV